MLMALMLMLASVGAWAQGLTPVGFDPEDGSVKEGSFPATFTVKFSEALTLDNTKVGDIKLYKNSVDAANEIAPEAGSWSVNLESGKKSVYIYSLDEYFEGVQYITAEAGAKYILVVPAGLVKNATEVANEEIQLTINGPEQVVAEPVKLLSSDPFSGAVYEGYAPVSFELTFDSEVKTTSALIGSNVKLFKGSKDGEEYVPDGGWNFNQGSDKTKVQVFAMDMDYYVDNLNIQAGDKYFLVISGGTFTNANGDQNEEIVIELNGPDAPATAFNPTSIYPEEGGVMQGFLGIVFPRLEITFEEAAKIVAATPAVELRKGSEDGEVLPIDHWALVESSDTKTVILEGRDAVDDAVNFTADDVAYYFIIPAGVVENADGAKNEKMVIKVYGTEGAATGISSVVSEGKTLKGDVYTIGGVKVRKSGESLNGLKGVYIVNGKKVVVK
jgi:methionine-rich copper-binding protein CopC